MRGPDSVRRENPDLRAAAGGREVACSGIPNDSGRLAAARTSAFAGDDRTRRGFGQGL
jgi:hypothetical protein